MPTRVHQRTSPLWIFRAGKDSGKMAGSRLCATKTFRRSLSNGASRLLTQETYINGRWISSADFGSGFDVHCPATETVIANVPDMGAKQVTEAVDAAQVSLDEISAGLPCVGRIS